MSLFWSDPDETTHVVHPVLQVGASESVHGLFVLWVRSGLSTGLMGSLTTVSIAELYALRLYHA